MSTDEPAETGDGALVIVTTGLAFDTDAVVVAAAVPPWPSEAVAVMEYVPSSVQEIVVVAACTPVVQSPPPSTSPPATTDHVTATTSPSTSATDAEIDVEVPSATPIVDGAEIVGASFCGVMVMATVAGAESTMPSLTHRYPRRGKRGSFPTRWNPTTTAESRARAQGLRRSTTRRRPGRTMRRSMSR